MKNTINRPQRNFVVEYKSKSRQPKAGAVSIWGNTNMKALAQAVEGDMPPAQIAQDNAPLSEANGPKDEIVARAEGQTGRPAATIEMKAPPATSQIFAETTREIEARHASAPGAELKRRRRKQSAALARAKQTARPARSASGETSVSIAAAGQSDILFILDRENRRLKRLLVKKLQSENMRLKAMLKRFDA